MSVHLERELGKLRRRVLSLGARVEDAIAKAVEALRGRDAALAAEIIEADSEIDRMEVEVEEECLKILALYQPVAADLRFIIAVLKMNNDLERMADLASNIAQGARRLAGREPVAIPEDIGPMAAAVRSMVKRSLDALVNADAALADRVCMDDDTVDDLKRNVADELVARMARHPDRADQLMTLFIANGLLERLGDMATNVSEDVIYMVQGKIVRHQAVSSGAG